MIEGAASYLTEEGLYTVGSIKALGDQVEDILEALDHEGRNPAKGQPSENVCRSLRADLVPIFRHQLLQCSIFCNFQSKGQKEYSSPDKGAELQLHLIVLQAGIVKGSLVASKRKDPLQIKQLGNGLVEISRAFWCRCRSY